MIVNRLPEILELKNISIRELSRLTGITYTTIRAVYHGGRRSVQLDVLDSICNILEIQPGDIYQYYQNESDIKSIVIPNPDPQVTRKIVSSSVSEKGRRPSTTNVQDPDWRIW